MITLRPSQQKALDVLSAVSYGILNAPTGWGKSMVLCAIAGDDLLEDATRKVVICLPQRVISKGFVNNVKIKLNGKTFVWKVGANLCADGLHKVSRLKEFLTSPASGTIADRVVVTTHMGLGYAFAGMTDDEITTAIDNKTFVIDEGHHIQASDDGFNQLGAIVKFILETDNPSTRLLFATAFFFRGDNLPILADKHLQLFLKHTIPFDEHWKAMKHLKSYLYDFVAYKGSPWKPLDRLLQESQEPTLIYVPPEGSKHLLGKAKSDFVKRLLRTLKRHYPDAAMWEPECDADQVILDLVDMQHRGEKVSFAMQHGDKIAVILTVGMFREGADWQQAARVIDLTPSGSDQDRNQRFGRLIRDFPNKTKVSYYSFLPQLTDVGDQRLQLTKLYAHFVASLVLENALSPIKIPMPDSETEPSGDGRGRPIDLLGGYDEQTQENVLYDSCEALISLAAGGEVTADAAERTIVSVLKEYGIDNHPMAKQIALILRRKANLNLPVKELVAFGFDKIWASDALEGIRLFSAGFGGPETFKEIRKTILGVFEQTWHEMYDKIKDLPTAPPTNNRSYWWITNNKSFYRDGRLSRERITLLEQISWWKWQNGFGDRWHTRWEELSKLKACPKAGTKEYAWVRQQRRMFAQRKLSAERIEKCNSIAWWSWNDYSQQWTLSFAAVAELADAPKSRDPHGDWVKYQRSRYQQGKLSGERITQCESIQWWTW